MPKGRGVGERPGYVEASRRWSKKKRGGIRRRKRRGGGGGEGEEEAEAEEAEQWTTKASCGQGGEWILGEADAPRRGIILVQQLELVWAI